MISKNFLLAGNAIFTVSNPQCKHYTFRVNKSKSTLTGDPVWFISVLTGPDNSNDYSYVGMVFSGGVCLTRASKYTKDSMLYKVADWSVCGILSGGSQFPDGYSISHAGTCGRCGRKLTTPKSIELGLGPVCAGLS